VSVRNRLALILAVVLLPLLLGAGFVVAIAVPDRLQSEAHDRLSMAASSVASLQVQTCLGAGDSARVMALAVAGGEDPMSAIADGLDRRGGYATVLRGDTRLAQSTGVPPGLSLDGAGRVRCSSGSVRAAVATQGGALPVPAVQDSVLLPTPSGQLRAVVAVVLDRRTLAQWWVAIGGDTSLELAVACPGGGQAATTAGARGEQLRAHAKAVLEGRASSAVMGEIETAAPGAGHPCLVLAATPRVGGLAGAWWTWLVLGLAAVLGAGLVWWLARQLTLPVVAVTDAAARVAGGDLQVRLPADRQDELGRLAASFNNMAAQLDQRLKEVEHSRDLLSDNIQRLGDALQRTHDLDGLLATVCAIAAATTGSVRATAWLVEGNSMVSRVAWPVDSLRSRVSRVPRSGTLPGDVVSDGTPRRLPAGDQAALLGGPSLCTPLQRGDSMLGAVVVEREVSGAAYTQEDAATLMSITGPAGIAMDNALLHRQAQRMSVIDPLTGVGNLRMLTGTLAGEVERARHFGRSVSLLILDLDHFRVLNDSYGHAAGDAILAAVAARVSASVRSVDRVARYGGEEFAVVCPELDVASARALAEHLWTAVREEPFDIGGTPVTVRISVGVASWPEQARTSTELLRAADAAMAQAKRSGRDRVAQAGSGSR